MREFNPKEIKMSTKPKTIKLDLSVFNDAELRAIELEIADRRKKSEQAARDTKVKAANTRIAEIRSEIYKLTNEAVSIVDTTKDEDVYLYLSIVDNSSEYRHYNGYWTSSSY